MPSASFGWTAYGTPLHDDGGVPGGRDGRLELADVGRLARRATRGLVGVARAEERETLSSLLHAHLAAPVEELDVVEEGRPAYEHVNVQAGLDAWLAADHRSHRLVGIVGYQHRQFGLAELLEGIGGAHDPFGPRPGNVSRVNLPSGPGGQVASCVRCGLYLVDDDGSPLAVLLRGADPESGLTTVTVEITGPDAATVAAAARDIQDLATTHNVFRGQVLSFDHEIFGHGGTLLQFHERPAVGTEDVILPAAAAEAIRRQVVEVARHKERLLSAGQHLKRGLLLYGPPGVGKTHTVRHLISSLTGTTVIQLTGGALSLISEACSVARALQPAMVVVEDVDLIAEDRDLHSGAHPLLFQLLGEMDGLAEDADVVFVLTTNRADLLEPALAARPGRVDQAVELPLPDGEARRRLFELYAGTLVLDRSNLDSVVERTEGVTASFVKELLRRAALFAAERSAGDGALAVSAEDLDAALSELLDTRNAMTRVVLGGSGNATRED
ncbi:AAA family ATPase [Oceanitalea stevensii]|uniref:26S protease regulatory subunit n=1 Tax=Oceanitalea stevensii TaxID=2763072 RepID=A0ABR8Z441_9MICO|nr:ATP-binding protein [Oceanitalea stevensii]MBD8063009.1 26S protease regulatory subunit [Oceanitalea stevensii]